MRIVDSDAIGRGHADPLAQRRQRRRGKQSRSLARRDKQKAVGTGTARTPVLRRADALPAGQLVLGAAERLHHLRLVLVARAHRQQDLTDLDAGDGAVRLTEGATHAGLQTAMRKGWGARRQRRTRPQWHAQMCTVFPNHATDPPSARRGSRTATRRGGGGSSSGAGASTVASQHCSTTEGGGGGSGAPIGTSARKHLVDAQHVPRVHTDTQVERLLARVLDHVLVARDTRGLERLRRDLLLLDRHKVGSEGELVDAVLLLASVVDPDLRVCGHDARPTGRGSARGGACAGAPEAQGELRPPATAIGTLPSPPP